MNKAVDPVLELLVEDLILNRRAIYHTLRYRSVCPDDAPGESTIYRALDSLEEHGFVARIPENESYFRITEKGSHYLRGEEVDDDAWDSMG